MSFDINEPTQLTTSDSNHADNFNSRLNELFNNDDEIVEELGPIEGMIDEVASAAVVDEGSTSDGDYIRYENGWQICVVESGEKDTGITYFDLFDEDPYPASFESVLAKIPGGINRTDGGRHDFKLDWPLDLDYNSDSDTGRMRIYDPEDGMTVRSTLLVIGRWE